MCLPDQHLQHNFHYFYRVIKFLMSSVSFLPNTFKNVFVRMKDIWVKNYLLVVLIPGFDSCDNVIMSRISKESQEREWDMGRDIKGISKLPRILLILPYKISCIKGSSEIPLLSLGQAHAALISPATNC